MNSSSSRISRTAASSAIGSMPPYVTIVVSPPAKPLPEKVSAGYGQSVSRHRRSPTRPSTGRRFGRPYMSLFSMKKTGSSSATAACSSAPMSWHSLGSDDRDARARPAAPSPATGCASGRSRGRPPIGVRTTSGTRTWSSNIARNFAIPLTIWSKPSAMKSPNMISRIGR